MIHSTFAGTVKEVTDIEIQYWKHRIMKAQQEGKKVLVFTIPDDMCDLLIINDIEEYLQTEIEHHLSTERKSTDSTNQSSESI